MSNLQPQLAFDSLRGRQIIITSTAQFLHPSMIGARTTPTRRTRDYVLI
jgi:hypothetical protein